MSLAPAAGGWGLSGKQHVLHCPKVDAGSGCEKLTSLSPQCLRCGVTLPASPRSCGSSILMEETAKAIATLDPAVCPWGHLRRFAWPALPETLVRTGIAPGSFWWRASRVLPSGCLNCGSHLLNGTGRHRDFWKALPVGRENSIITEGWKRGAARMLSSPPVGLF
jgi:hypothetical protein